MVIEHHLAQEKIRNLAYFDVLTQLPNRRMLVDRLRQAMANGRRSGCHGALMFLDLDNFKPLNDAHGHEVGDLLRIEVADRLKACVREMDTVARFGGDEFIIMIRELDSDKVRSTAQARVIAMRNLASSYGQMPSLKALLAARTGHVGWRRLRPPLVALDVKRQDVVS